MVAWGLICGFTALPTLIYYTSRGSQDREYWKLSNGNTNKPESYWSAILKGLAVSAVAGTLLWFCTSVVVTLSADHEWVKTGEANIYAMKDNSVTYYIRNGQSNSQMRYYYLAHDGTDAYKTFWASTDISSIEESNGEPKVEYYELGFKNKGLADNFVFTEQEYKDIFYIPQGSIKYDFNVDLQN